MLLVWAWLRPHDCVCRSLAPFTCTVCRQQLGCYQNTARNQGQPKQPAAHCAADCPPYCRQAQRTKFAKPLVEKAARAILLSGTPALSNPVELLTQLQALLPRARITKAAFEERYMHVRHYGKFSKAVSIC